jgi:hypothetical protein
MAGILQLSGEVEIDPDQANEDKEIYRVTIPIAQHGPCRCITIERPPMDGEHS